MLSNIDIMPAARLTIPFTSGGKSRSGKRISVHVCETPFGFAGWNFSIWQPPGCNNDQPYCTLATRGPIVGAYGLEGFRFHEGFRRAKGFAIYHDPKTGSKRTPPEKIEESMFGVRTRLQLQGDWYVVESTGRPDIFEIGEPIIRLKVRA